MDTIIWLMNNHHIYVGDYYKNNIKMVTFEKVDSWEFYGADDVEELIDYMNYPLQYNRFRNNQIIILFDEVKTYEMLTKVQKNFKESAGIMVKRIESFLLEVALKQGMEPGQKISFADRAYELIQMEEGIKLHMLEEEPEEKEEVLEIKPLTIFEDVVERQKEETFQKQIKDANDIFKYELVLSPTTLFIQDGQREKRFLQVEDVLMTNTLVKDETYMQKGDILFKYKHNVQKLFGRIKTEEVAKKLSKEGVFYFVKPFNVKENVWAYRDEVLGIVGPREESKEALLKWYREIVAY